jgi:hypothetical protein
MIKAKTQQRLLRAALQKRGYATPSSSLDFNVTEANGFKLALQEGLSSPTSAITLAIKAGSRYEPTAGAAHALKNFVFRVSLSRRAFGTWPNFLLRNRHPTSAAL